jgi:putative ABC transport system permease protein
VNLLTLALAYLRARFLASLLQVLLLAIGLAAIVVMLLVSSQVADRVDRDTRGIDLVVGAKGSPLQLVLSSVFHVDSPTGNIPYEQAMALRKHPLVRKAIPLALGDAWRGYRIVGTEHALVEHYGATLATGRLWADEMQAVVGAEAARSGGPGGAPLKIGDTIVGSHGLVDGGTAHDEHPYEVVGILAPTGGVIDRLVLVSVETVWDVHPVPTKPGVAPSGGAGGVPPAAAAAPGTAAEPQRRPHRHAHDHDHDKPARKGTTSGNDGAAPGARPGPAMDAASPAGTAASATASTAAAPSHAGRELTALLIQYASPMAAAQLPRQINAATAMQAASPAAESVRLNRLVGIGVDTLRVFAGVLLVAAGLALFISLYGALSERERDLAMLRVLGARRTTLLALMLLEGLLLCLAGGLLGLLGGHALAEWLGRNVPALSQWALTGWTFAPGEGWLVVLALLIGAFASMLPAVLAYRTDIAKVLARA